MDLIAPAAKSREHFGGRKDAAERSQGDMKHEKDSTVIAGRVPHGMYKKQCGQPLGEKTSQEQRPWLTASKKIKTSVPHYMEPNSAISEMNSDVDSSPGPPGKSTTLPLC